MTNIYNLPLDRIGINRLKGLLGCLLLTFCSSSLIAGEVTLNAGVDNDFIKQNVNPEDGDDVDTNNIIIKPYLSILYGSRKLDLLISGEHNHVRRSFEDEDATNNYTNFNYRATYEILENVFRVSANGASNYRSSDINSVFVDDFLLNADNLVKTNSNSLIADLTLLNRKYFNLNSNLRYSESDTERQQAEQLFQGFENKSYSGQVLLTSGTNLRPLSYSISGQSVKTERANRGDYTNDNVSLTLGSEVYGGFSAQLLGSYEANEIDNSSLDPDSDEDFASSREFYSVGAGIAWQSSNNRSIQLGINRSTTKNSLGDGEDEEDTFISGNINWQFTSRTRLSASTTRRFFGESNSLSFSHNTRNWRNRLSYNESVQSNSTLVQNQALSLFVCDGGSTDLADCFIPDVLDPAQLEPGQTILPIVETNFDFNDNITLRKLWSFTSSLQRRRTNLILLLSHSNSDALELEREIDTSIAQLTASLRLSRRASIKLVGKYSNIDSTVSGELSESIVRQIELSLSRDLSRRLTAEIGVSHLNRTGDSAVGIGNVLGIRGPLTDNRITASINYKFTNR